MTNKLSYTMKTLITVFGALLITSLTFAQDLVTALQIEYTVTGYQYGSSIMAESRKQWGLGAFYQTSKAPSSESFKQGQFYGVQIQVPLAKSERISFFAALRGGLVNNRFVVIVPGLKTRIDAGKRWAISFGMSMRRSYPALTSEFMYKIF